MAHLSIIMRIQALAIAVYGLAFTFLPDFSTDTLFGWDGVDPSWVRASGLLFAVLAWAEWLVVRRLGERLDLVWPFVALPGFFGVAFVAERVTDVYQGPDSFWWANVVVVVLLFLGVLWGRLTVTEQHADR